MPARSLLPARIPAPRRLSSRRRPIGALVLMFAGLTAFGAAAQQPRPNGAAAAQARPSGPLEVDITQGTLNPIPIAVPEFIGDDPKLATEVADVVAGDLERSGLFRPLDRASFIDRNRDPNGRVAFQDWRAVRADALTLGKIYRAPNGGITAEFRLWDAASGKQLVGQRLTTAPQNWRRLGHQIADMIYERLTGEKGYFDTRVVFVDETGPKAKRLKRLAIMDQDGANVRLLSQGQELALTPRFSPTNQEITYVAYVKEVPKVFVMNIENGQRVLAGDFPGITLAPRFSPDGQRLVMSQGEGGFIGIIEYDLRSRQARRLTQGQWIDTGPSYSPDGRQIVFESDREGTQQLYVMNADGSGVRRLSHGDGRYSTPVWSPRGDLIAFTKTGGGQFKIGVMRPDGSGERILTDGFHNEGPTWAPNGRVLMFFRERQGGAGSRLYSVDLTGYNEREVPTPTSASDPAWSPVLN